MLTIFRRHLASCKYRSRRFKGCSCPISVEGRLHGEYVRKSLDVRNWESAQKLVRDWEAGDKYRTVPMNEACDLFLKDCEARKLGPAQLGKYLLLTRELKGFFPERLVSSISIEDASAYRESWDMSPVSSGKKLERLRGFLRFCMERGWIQDNPARLLKAPKVKQKPTMPFSPEEWEKIVWATELYPDYGKWRRQQVKAFVMLLRYSGLRIGDAVSLETKRIQDGKLLLYTAKAGTPVWLPLPEEVVSALQRIPDPDRFFWSGIGKLKSAVADWQRTLAKLFKLAGVKGHAHMFRDTMAVDLLQRGVSLENVAAILGNTVRVAEKHYAPWVKSRQVELEKAVKKTWENVTA
jgi:site-specific recombinase XerD